MKPLSSNWAIAFCSLLFLAMPACGQESPGEHASDQAVTVPAEGAQQPSQQMLQLVAPVALYPDALLAETLTAAKHPADVIAASRWEQRQSALGGQPREVAVNAQPWDASVKGLAQFPSVLDLMSGNPSWTAALADAFANEPDAVVNAIQTLRRRAQSVGTLKSTGEQIVTAHDQAIVIDPAIPDFVYVPDYDPWLVYGAPLEAYPDWTRAPGTFYVGLNVAFGVDLDEGAFPTFPWAWQYWSFDWPHHSVLHDHGHSDWPGVPLEHGQLEHRDSSRLDAPFGDAGGFYHDGMEGGYPPHAPIAATLPSLEFGPHPFGDGPSEGGFHGDGSDEGGLHGGGYRGGGSHR